MGTFLYKIIYYDTFQISRQGEMFSIIPDVD